MKTGSDDLLDILKLDVDAMEDACIGIARWLAKNKKGFHEGD